MHEVDVVIVGDTPSEIAPLPGLAAIWPRVAAVLRHYAWLNADEARVRDLQFGILQQGAFIVPSIYGEGGDFCRSSYYIEHRVFYRFAEGSDAYYWITSQLDRCYSLGVLYLPAYQLALALYPHTIDAGLLERFEQVRLASQRPATAFASPPPIPTWVVGNPHMIHHLWNELPAIDRALAAGLGPRSRIVATHQPLGPLDQIFPELRGHVTAMPMAEVTALSSSVEMFTSLGAWSIPASTQSRVIRVARRHLASATLAEQERFRTRHGVIFWLSVKPPDRTCSDQVATLAAIIEGLHAAHPGAGFLIDGVSYPWDYESNPNYLSWYTSVMEKASAKTSTIINELLELLPAQLRLAVRIVTDVPVMEEIAWASIADFYFCHGGSMQNKVGWLHSMPGVIHSNTSFMTGARGMIAPVERAVSAYFLPDELIVDDDPTGYSEMQLARKDQNYRFTSIPAVLEFILACFDQRDAVAARTLAPAAVPLASESARALEDTVPPYISDEARIIMATRPRDCDIVPKVADAGQVRVENGTRVQVMHNGLRVVADCYCGPWMTRLIELCEGHHEAQEERMFHEVLRFMPQAASMIELGGYWSYYSLWFLQGGPERRAIVLEPDPRNLEIGRANAELNGLAPSFVAGLAGKETAASVLFRSETQGDVLLPRFTVEQIMREHGLQTVDILHCDTQGAELDVLQSCLGLFAEGRIGWAFISTHAEIISGDALTHQRCLALLQDAGASIEAEHDVHESFSGDGLIVARFGPRPAGWSPVTLSYNRYSESLFRNPLYDLALSRRAAAASPAGANLN